MARLLGGSIMSLLTGDSEPSTTWSETLMATVVLSHGEQLTLKIGLPASWLDAPCSKLVAAFAKQYNTQRSPALDVGLCHLARDDGTLLSKDAPIRDVVGSTLTVVDPCSTLHYKVQSPTGVVVKTAPAYGGPSLGVKPKWAIFQVDQVIHGWVRLNRAEVVEAYGATHVFRELEKQQEVQAWMPTVHMTPVVVRPNVVEPNDDDKRRHI